MGMKLSTTVTILSVGMLGIGCVTREPGLVQTQILSYPDGAVVEYNGQRLGRTPAKVTLPQDSGGRLTEKAEIRLLPNSDQATLFPQVRTFDPATRGDRVPDRIMVDMTRGGTKATTSLAQGKASHIEAETKSSARPPVPYTERSKPTQAVGLDRWKPGIY